MKLIVGLGNPGLGYASTRHNLGARVVKAVGKKYKARFKTDRSFKSKIAKIDVDGAECLLALPVTFMNLSGRAVGPLLSAKDISPKDLLVVHDDLDLDLGELRFRKKGSAGGHKGVASTIEAINTQEFGRLKLGIGKSPDKEGTKDYVLSGFCRVEIKTLDGLVKRAVKGCLDWIESGIDEVMKVYNQGGQTKTQLRER